jgi:Fe2+ or Zn2+ uptake regulation protein
MNEVKRYLLKNNIKPSFPRLKVFEYLAAHPSHPTVDDIYQALTEEMPTLSKTTIYNTLDLFVQSNIARAVTIDGNELRYDVDITNHGHFKCDQCNTIYEFDIDSAVLAATNLDGFDIREKNVYFKGTCPRCLAGRELNQSV